MKNTFSILILFIVNFTFAQKSIVASGGKAIGTAGTASFSVGLVSYKNPEGNSINDGMQQPFEIQTLVTSYFASVELLMIAYPNPAIDQLYLKIAEQHLKDYSYQLYDSAGKTLLSEKINLEESLINMKDCNTGIYFLDVTSKDKKIKTFKILKK
ncbi:T9SS type A sorting domain-containing protein [Flavobacterium sp.]|uniref:T9SS type A sorting domain-containing protein n=1 Tax=Flavobacterium sp. TaxID=239 RepID=UPI003BD4C496